MALFDQQANGTGGESFIARQRRLQGQQNAEAAGVPQGTGQQSSPFGAPPTPFAVPSSAPQGRQPAAEARPAGQPATPVTGNGKIPDPQPAPQAVPQPTAPTVTSLTTQSGQASAQTAAPVMGTYGPQGGNPGAMNGQSLQAMDLGNQPITTYTPQQFQTQVTTPGSLPISYQGSNYSQFQGPNQQATEAAQQDLVQRMLANPETLGPEVLGALKEKQKEAALLMEKQNLQSAQQNAASRGFGRGGSVDGIEAAIRGNTANSVINSNRDLDIAAASQNRQDILNALGASEGVLSGQMGRSSTAFGNTLAGQSAQANDTRSVAQDAISRAISGNDAALRAQQLNLQKEGMQLDENYRGYESARSGQDAAMNRILAQFGINKEANLANLQGELGRGGLKLDNERLGETTRQFNEGHQLNILQFLENQRQANNNLGFNYTQLGQNSQNSLLAQVLSLIGG